MICSEIHLCQELREISMETVLGDLRNVGQVRSKVETRRNHMNIMKRCHFELKGTTQFDGLVERLREFIVVLRNICSETQAMVRLCPWIFHPVNDGK